MKINISFHQFSSGFIAPVLVLTIAVFGYFLLLPKYRDLRVNQKVLAEKQAEVLVKESQLQSVQDLISDFKKKREELLVLDDSLPDAPRIPELIANIETLTQNSGLLISSMHLTLPTTLANAQAGQSTSQFKRLEGLLNATENLAVLQVDLVLKGEYLNVKTFLQNLEQNLRLMDAMSFTFSPVQRESRSQEYSVKIETYYYKK